MQEDFSCVRRLSTSVWPLVAFSILGLGLQALAEVPSNAQIDWAPPIADPSQNDSITLDTDERLEGEMKSIRDGTVHFDSSELGELQLDWDEVSEMRLARAHTFRFTGRRILTGSAAMRGDIIQIRTAEELRQFKRSDLVSMVHGTGRGLDYWSLNVSLGFSGQSGNTDQLSLNSALTLRRETGLTRANLAYSGNVATQQRTVSANNHRVAAVLDVYLSRRLYLVVPSLVLFQDQFQNISWRLTPSVGMGYDVVSSKKVDGRVGFAVGYQATQYDSVSAGDDRQGDAAIQLDASLDVDLPNRFDWTTSYQSQLVVTDIGKTSQTLISTLSFDFWGPLDFDTTFQWNWVAEPVANAQGTLPESSDFILSVGLALDL